MRTAHDEVMDDLAALVYWVRCRTTTHRPREACTPTGRAMQLCEPPLAPVDPCEQM